MRSIRLSEDVVPLGEFKARASTILRSLSEQHRPVLITQNGQAAGVLLSPAEYDRCVKGKPFLKRSLWVCLMPSQVESCLCRKCANSWLNTERIAEFCERCLDKLELFPKTGRRVPEIPGSDYPQLQGCLSGIS